MIHELTHWSCDLQDFVGISKWSYRKLSLSSSFVRITTEEELVYLFIEQPNKLKMRQLKSVIHNRHCKLILCFSYCFPHDNSQSCCSWLSTDSSFILLRHGENFVTVSHWCQPQTVTDYMKLCYQNSTFSYFSWIFEWLSSHITY